MTSFDGNIRTANSATRAGRAFRPVADTKAPPAVILTRLREGTREQHQRLEQVVDLKSGLSSLTAYTRLLELFYGVYRPLESRLSHHSQLGLSGLARNRLDKHLLLEQDLLALGRTARDIEALPTCSRVPDLSDAYSAAGCLYVLEGSTLGGQVVSREVDKRLQLSNDGGCMFFTSYGPHVRVMWSAFCTQLAALAGGSAQGHDAIVQGASETFTCLEEWFR